MENDCIFMSLDHDMVRKMKALRPSWRVGLLVAKAIGDLTELKADFLAVEARMATRRVRAAGASRRAGCLHLDRQRSGLDVCRPEPWCRRADHRQAGSGRKVIERARRMSEPQRFLVAQLIRLGASTESLEAENALRP